MSNMIEYLNFIKTKGRPVTEINPGSDEYALECSDAYHALDLLKENKTIVLGGDIFTEDECGELVYAYQLWGQEYHYLNWYCDKILNESDTGYLKKSHEVARASISKANDIAESLKKKCLIVFVI